MCAHKIYMKLDMKHQGMDQLTPKSTEIQCVQGAFKQTKVNCGHTMIQHTDNGL